MPHLVLDGEVDLDGLAAVMPRQAIRWRAAVIKNEQVWLRCDRRALLVEGVVVEHSRPLHPVAVVALHEGTTSVRIWARSEVERTPSVQRWLAEIAAAAGRAGCRAVRTTNLPADVVADLDLTP